MRKIGKRIISLLVVFVSIISLLPVNYFHSMKIAYAASSDDLIAAATIKVSEANNPKEIKPYKDSVDSSIDVYSTDFAPQKGFDIFVNNITVTKDELGKEAEKLAEKGFNGNGYSQKTYETEKKIVSQEIKIKYIDGLVADPSELSAGKASIGQIGVTIEDCGSVIGQKRLGKTIVNLPLGVNRIEYEVTIKKQKAIYDTTTNKVTYSDENSDSETFRQEIIINNGKKFVINQIQQLRFYQYIGADKIGDLEIDKENNQAPFLYEADAKADSEIPLRYTWEVPDSLQTLTYTMTFGMKINNSSTVKVYKNGTEQTNTEIENNSIKGSLSKISTSELIVVNINGTGTENGVIGPISKLYSIELRYPPKSPAEDFSMQKAGLTKYQYNDNKDVKAYIGKRFEIEEKKDEERTILEYNGEVHIDPKAGLISFNPTLVAQSGQGVDLTYELSLKYTLNGQEYTDPNIELIDNKQFIPFNKGDENTIVLSVYNKGKLVCRYNLKVLSPDTATENFNMDLKFDGNDEGDNTFLTAEGACEKNDSNEAKSKQIKFSKDRPNYDLYTKRQGTVDIGLVSTTETNEYLKVYLSDSVNGGNAKEAEESKENTINENSGARNSDLTINFGNAKSMIVQAYYDEVEKYEDENGQTKYKVIKSYPVGRKYTFNIRANIKDNQGNNGVIKSDNANLSSIKIKGETLETLSGKKGFSSENFDYEVKVDKDKKSSLITVIPEDENVKSMIATIQETGEQYELYSGEELELSLNKSGTTTVNIEVTAQDGKSTKNYSVRITNNTKGGNSKLKSITLSTGDYEFDPSQYTTNVYVDQTVNKISVSPIAEDPEAKVTVDGQIYVSTAISVSLVGTQKKEIEIVVTSEDGKSKTTYTLIVKRVTSSSDNNNDYGNKDDSYYDYDNNIWIDNTKYDEWGTTSDGRVVYYDKKGRQVKNAWVQTNNKYYYLNSSGYRATGWKVDTDGKTYYLDPSTGEMKTGWIYVDGSTYYLNPRGIMQKGWLNLNNKWYYFTQNGQMLVNTSMYIDGQLYKFAQDGAMYY